VMKDDSYVRRMIALLTSIDTQVRAAVGRGEALEQVRKSVDLELYRRSFAGDSALRAMLFANYVQGPSVNRAFMQLTGKL